jgi:hypothetical protein
MEQPPSLEVSLSAKVVKMRLLPSRFPFPAGLPPPARHCQILASIAATLLFQQTFSETQISRESDFPHFPSARDYFQGILFGGWSHFLITPKSRKQFL